MALAGEKIRPSGRQALDAAERELRETIAAADAAPFLGHHDLPDGAEDGLQGEL